MKRKSKKKKAGRKTKTKSKATTKRKVTAKPKVKTKPKIKTKPKATAKPKATTGVPVKATSGENFQQYIARVRAERRKAEAERQRLYRAETKKRALAHAKRIRAFEVSAGKKPRG